MPFTFCTSFAIVNKAGANAGRAASSAAMIAEISDQVEQYINMVTRKDYISAYSSLSTNKRAALSQAEACLGGMHIIADDMSGYTSLGEAQTMLDLLNSTADNALKLLKDKTYTEQYLDKA